MLNDPLNVILLLAAAFGAGALNAVAGGGSFLTLPALVFTGVPPVVANATFTKDNGKPFWFIENFDKMSLYIEAVWRSGRRYTPYLFTGLEPTSGRPIYVVDANPENKFSKLSDPWFWVDLNYKKWWSYKKLKIAWSVEITNLFNNKNAAIVNPVTGKAFKTGDDVPTEWRDARYTDPRIIISN